MTVILAIANQNGGVGKTVTAANVSAGFARAGRRTLAVDCDAQADLTRWLLDRADQDAADLEAIVVGGADPAAAVHPTRVAGLDALPATPRLAHIARALAADGTLIARALGRLRPRYDAMVLDLPSSLGRLTVSALAAADGIVIPVTASVAGCTGWPASATGWPASAPTASSPRRCGVCCSPRPTWTSRGGCGPGWAATCATPSPTSGSLARGCCRCWCPAGSVWTTWCPSGCCWATRRPMPGRAETWSTPTPGWSTTCWSGYPQPRGPQPRGHAVSAEHERVVTTDRFTSDDRAVVLVEAPAPDPKAIRDQEPGLPRRHHVQVNEEASAFSTTNGWGSSWGCHRRRRGADGPRLHRRGQPAPEPLDLHLRVLSCRHHLPTPLRSRRDCAACRRSAPPRCGWRRPPPTPSRRPRSQLLCSWSCRQAAPGSMVARWPTRGTGKTRPPWPLVASVRPG